MRIRECSITSVLAGILSLAMVFATPRVASAQLSVGAYVGAEFDNQDNWILYGAEARLPLNKYIGQPIDGNIRYTYHSYGSGFSVSQLDFNALHNWELAHPGLFAPYVGLGAAWLHGSGGGSSENKVGLNLISGTKLVFDPNSRVEPFVNMQYTIAREYPNSYTLTLGLSYRFGSQGKTTK